jgi:hypothetical protein
MTLVMALAVVGWIAIRVGEGLFDPRTDLSFDFCKFTTLLLPKGKKLVA